MQILITGATGSIGRALCEHFAAAGHIVIGVGRSKNTLGGVVRPSSDCFVALEQDLVLPDASTAMLAKLEARDLSPNVLVNCARSIASLRIEADGLVTRQNFLDEYLLDVVVPYELTMALARHPARSLRSVINIGSMYGSVVPNRYLYDDFDAQSPIQYGVAKAGLVHLTKELAVRLAPQSISVNCVAYGGVEGRASSEFMSRYGKLAPTGRMLKHYEIAAPVNMLISNASPSVTGQVIHADGGWTLW